MKATDDDSPVIHFVPGTVHSCYRSEAASLLGSTEIIWRMTGDDCQLKEWIIVLENKNKNTKQNQIFH